MPVTGEQESMEPDATHALLNSLTAAASALPLNEQQLLTKLLRKALTAQTPEIPHTTDPVVSQALKHIHQEPARAWTTETLAAAIAVSRATLTRRFPPATGLSPAAYLTQWRMNLAATQLHHTDDSIGAVAAAVGYFSVPAFSRAFYRAHGKRPGRYRADLRRQS